MGKIAMKEDDIGSAFEKGLCWTLYRYHKRDLLRFFEYVPCTEGNQLTYSPKLLDLLMRVCGYMDDVFKQMLVFKDFTEAQKEIVERAKSKVENHNIFVARDAFEPIYRLSSNCDAKPVAKSGWFGEKELRPFEKFGLSGYDEKCLPDWWHSYNNVKHHWSSSIEQANIVNVLNALAGAFLLNAVHYPSVEYLWDQRVLVPEHRIHRGYDDKAFFYTDFDRDLEDAIRKSSRLPFGHKVETPLFRYRYQKDQDYV
jgi:hypothetical protein